MRKFINSEKLLYFRKMIVNDDAIVGKKGEILPKKHLRKVSSINPGDKVIIEASFGELKIKKVFSIDEAFDLPIINKQTPQEIEKELEEQGRLQQELSENE